MNCISLFISYKERKEEEADAALAEANRHLTSALRNMQDADETSISTESFYVSDPSGSVNNARSACANIKIEGSGKEAKRNRNLVAGAVTSAVGGALAYGISKTVIDIKSQEITNEAMKTWMEEVGDHIKCYVGTEELGSYGTIVNFSID